MNSADPTQSGAPPPEGQEPPPESTPVASDDKEQRNWALFCHLSTLIVFVGVPFGNIIAPLVIWLVKRNEMPFVDDQGKEAVNFQISMTIYGIVSALLVFLLIGFLLIPIIIIIDLVFTIIAAIEASKGTAYRYPLTIRLLK